MSNVSSTEMHVEADLFAAVGVRLNVDVELYGQLLDELTTDLSDPVPPMGHFFPARSWVEQYTSIDKATRRRVYARTTEGGNYDPDHTLISVACIPSASDSNVSLLHETKHWDQDVHGDLQAGQRWLNAALGIAATGFLGGIAGVTAGICLKNGDLAGLSAFSAITSPSALYWYKTVGCKNERVAYRFERDPEIFRSYGRIIRYRANA